MRISGAIDERDPDPVNPAHYKSREIEFIDLAVIRFGEQRVREWCEITAMKYAWRRGQKDAEEQEVKKQIWYLLRSIGEDPR